MMLLYIFYILIYVIKYYVVIKVSMASFPRAIMKFHSMKMEEINKIIRDLWRSTYRGQGDCVSGVLFPKPSDDPVMPVTTSGPLSEHLYEIF